MDESRTVLIAIDASKQAENAFNWYCSHLRKDGDALLLAHAVEIPYVPTMPPHTAMMKDRLDQADNDAKTTVEKYMKLLEAKNIKGRVVSGHGRVGQYLCDLAKQEHAKYIVIGTRGMGKVRRTILGSVSDHVMHHAHCPVLIWRQ